MIEEFKEVSFNELKRLMDELEKEEFKNYKTTKEKRAILELISKEAKFLRKKIQTIWKAYDEAKKAKKAA